MVFIARKPWAYIFLRSGQLVPLYSHTRFPCISNWCSIGMFETIVGGRRIILKYTPVSGRQRLVNVLLPDPSCGPPVKLMILPALFRLDLSILKSWNLQSHAKLQFAQHYFFAASIEIVAHLFLFLSPALPPIIHAHPIARIEEIGINPTLSSNILPLQTVYQFYV